MLHRELTTASRLVFPPEGPWCRLAKARTPMALLPQRNGEDRHQLALEGS
jgi:hypothetical protein